MPTKSTTSCSRNEIVLLPIPFTDLSSTKVRPAIVIGFGSHPDDIFVVPVTSQAGNADFLLNDWQRAGLNVQSGVKGQLCTVDRHLVRKVLGALSDRDRDELDRRLRRWLGL
jgi:mRNA interferase MazF